MIPLRDSIPSRTTPYVNYTMIGVCTLVFFAQLSDVDSPGDLVERYGMIPWRVTHPDQSDLVVRIPVRTRSGNAILERRLPPAGVPAWATLITCVFLHGGWMHFLGNMWFLHIFGDNVEDRFGHFGYLVFYLGCGAAASFSHLLLNANSIAPTIGASGAIAGVMGAYLLLYPRGRVLSLIPIIVFIEIVVLPAPVFLGVWFVIQLFYGTFASGATGVAWWAHIGGFAAGYVIAWALRESGQTRPAVELVRPGAERSRVYRFRPRDPHSWH